MYLHKPNEGSQHLLPLKNQRNYLKLSSNLTVINWICYYFSYLYVSIPRGSLESDSKNKYSSISWYPGSGHHHSVWAQGELRGSNSGTWRWVFIPARKY